MGKRRIKYICFYDDEENVVEKRLQSPAAHIKVSFIVSLLARLGYEIDIISPSQTLSHDSFPERETTKNGIRLKLFRTKGRSGFFSKAWRKLFGYSDFKRYLKATIRDGDVVIVYHSIEYLDFFLRLKKSVKFRLILELEELYSDSAHFSRRVQKKEILLARCADAFIFPTHSMETRFSSFSAPSVVIHGDYRPSLFANARPADSRGVVYCGTLDPEKGGAMIALRSASFLPKSIHLYIVGFGTPEQIKTMREECETEQAKAQCCISFLEQMGVEKTERLLSKSLIGLCTQDINGSFNPTSFPSKIITYLKCGLKVVSCDNESIKTSDVSDLLFFYKGNSPKSVAETILRAMETPDDPAVFLKRMADLEQKALLEIKQLLENMD